MYNFEYIKKTFPNVEKELENTPQDKYWHAEGNVSIHTEMVLKELHSCPFYLKLDQNSQKILSYAAFFHDHGKPDTTIFEDGHTRSPNHSQVGAKKTRNLLYNLGYDFAFRESVATLIRYHGYPIHFYKHEEKESIRVSLQVNNELLYILAKADIKGRITDPKENEETLMNVDYFKEICEKLECFKTPKHFESNKQRVHFLKTGILYLPFEDQTKSTVYLMSAIPRAGKDTYIKENFPELEVISLDNLRKKYKYKNGDKKGLGRIVQEAKKTAKEYMAKGIDFVWNATNTSLAMRTSLISLFQEYKATVNIIYIERDIKDILRDNNSCEDSEYVPEKYIKDLFKGIDIPDISEADTIKYIINGEENVK